ncbi:disks large-associated protein 1 isoform X2 [Syngnathoides biaculeatus]|uniref:disks large-associated protein 1 isoform X2 n=1 Tax=Syngnathoides biaculeatus TaxID=300417 RepID=UPI002ADD5132|nr:disks large-associated protein 1 isoform X2 [Syngnathoides biaculeatus]
MKGLSSSRSHHHVMSYEPSYEPLVQHVDRKPYLISQIDMPLPIAVPHPNELSYYNAQRTSYPSDSNSIVPYGTFPRRCHSTSSSHHPEVKDECMAMVPYVGGGGAVGGGGYGGKTPTRAPANFADPFEHQPSFSRDGYHTLQYKRGMLAQSGGIGSNVNNDSPGRIRHLVHSVQKLFTKSHSLEGPHHTQSVKGANNGSVNGGVGGGGGGGGGSRASPEGDVPLMGVGQRKRSKSRERCRSAEPKHRSHHHHHHQLHDSASAPGSGYWSSDDNLERELCLYHPHHHQPPPSPSPSISPSQIAMTMGRYPGNNPDKFPQSQKYFMMDPYGTISEHADNYAHHGHTHHHSALRASRSNNDVKYAAPSSCVPIRGSSNNIGGSIGGGSGPLLSLGLVDVPLVKKGTWSSSLTVPQDEWSTFSPLGKEDDIPCRRMRSGSYVKAMAEDDSGDSDGSPKPSPKIQARRASYLKATQPSLTEMTTLQISSEHSPKLQIRSHSYLRAVSEVSINRSLDTLDPKTLLDPKSLLSSPQYRSRNESYMRAMSTISQLSEVEVNGQIEQVCEQVYSEMQAQAMEAAMDRMERLDTMDTLPMPGCFRMRSHSYVRAIDQGCAGEEEGEGGRPLLLLPSSPPRTSATTVRTIQSSAVSSCITTYKKTPPPVPPRTSTCSAASKPYISITAQSSTESAQDAYMEEEGPRGDMTIQSGLSNSTESIDSMKALTAAIEAANAQIHGPASQHVSNSTVTINTSAQSVLSRGLIVEDYHDEYRNEELRKDNCLSIGIQVDGPEETPDPEDPSKFTSVGVQVEDDRRYCRIQRSNSVTAAVQADLDLPGLLDTPLDSPDADLEVLSSGVLSRRYSRDAATSTVSIQGSGNHYHACASDEYEDVGFDPSILPPPDPWIDSISDDSPNVNFNSSAILEVVQRTVCQRDGQWFLKLLQAETDRMEGWCQQMEMDQQHNDLPEDVLGKMRSAIGSAQLLMSQKFQQFRELCEENLNPHAHPRPVASDLAGFWDMLQLSIENISLKFDELHQLRANNWRPLDPPERK